MPGILQITNGTRWIKLVQESVKLSLLKIDSSKLFRFLYSEIDDPKDDGSVKSSMVPVGNSKKNLCKKITAWKLVFGYKVWQAIDKNNE